MSTAAARSSIFFGVVVLLMTFAGRSSATPSSAQIWLQGCSSDLVSVRHAELIASNRRGWLRLRCEAGFRFRFRDERRRFRCLETGELADEEGLPRCVRAKKKDKESRKKRIQSMLRKQKKSHMNIQSDDSRAHLVEPTPTYSEDGSQIVLMGEQDTEKLKYETQPDMSGQEGEQEGDYASYDYDTDYDPSAYDDSGPSDDYGVYYDYDYEENESMSSGDNEEEDAYPYSGADEEDYEVAPEQEAVSEAPTDEPENDHEDKDELAPEEDYHEDTDHAEDYTEEEDGDEAMDEDEDDYEDDDDDSYSDYEAEQEQIYRNYEILSDFYKKHFVDLRVLDTSCVPERVPPPEVDHGRVKEYRTVENVLLPGSHYHEVIYSCDPGWKLSESAGQGHMFCQQQGWMGVQPYCEEDPDYSGDAASSSEDHVIAGGLEGQTCDPGANGCEHLCQIKSGEPTCYCEPGYSLVDVTSCIDIDECLEDNGGCSHACSNKPGTYTCECPKGFTPDGADCVDINECVANNGHGPCQDICTNTEGSFTCACESHEGTVLSSDGLHCETVDLCATDNGGCSHECYTTYGQAYCMCPSGYKLSEDWKTCVDVDECATMSSVQEECGGEEYCVNTEGSYTCVQGEPEQHHVSSTQGHDHQDYEESSPPPYSTESPEYNVIDHTLCGDGYSFDTEQNLCVDVDECDREDVCGEEGHTCINNEGGYSCDCLPGFGFDGTICVDIDECNEDDTRCGNGHCYNTHGSYRCECYSGYELNERRVCVDIDECLTKCQSNGTICENSEGSFSCRCEDGFELTDSGDDCQDVDECQGRPCLGRARCVNSPGSYHCVCRGPGRVYDMSRGRCLRADPCQGQPCGLSGECVPNRGGFSCDCKEGYHIIEGQGPLCQDLDECAVNNGGCSHTCTNIDGSFTCSCPEGYKLASSDSKSCVDIDECVEGTHNCSSHCVNTVGSFECTCPPGMSIAPSSGICSCEESFVWDETRHGCVCPSGQEVDVTLQRCVHVVSQFEDGCPPLEETEGLEIRCSTELDGKTYARGTICRGKCRSGLVAEGRLKKKCRKDGRWSGNDGKCKHVKCPPLDELFSLKGDPHLRVSPEAPCGVSGQAAEARQRCKFSCAEGYKLLGSRAFRCRRDGDWKYNGGPPKCVKIHHSLGGDRYEEDQSIAPTVAPNREEDSTNHSATQNDTKAPYIYCPPDITEDMSSEAAIVTVRIPQPKTNVDWYQSVRATPSWAKNLEAELGLGKTLVTFQATNAVTGDSSSCSFTIHVRDTVPPRVYNCPADFNAYLDEGQVKKQVYWEEPIFSDNVKIIHVMASKMPGQFFTEGTHDVLYQATDEDGNSARCVFTISVFNARQMEASRRSWVICRIGSTGRLIKLFVAHVPRGCWKLSNSHTHRRHYKKH